MTDSKTTRVQELEHSKHKPLKVSIAMRLVVQHGENGRNPLDNPLITAAIRRIADGEGGEA